MKCIQADYVKNFFCDGKICGSRCCRDWKIPLDDDALKNFSTLDQAQQKIIFSNFADSTINLDENGFCAFLDKRDFFCKIQKAHGENFLPAICQTYPRVIYKIGADFFSQSMTLTCPVAANLILLRDSPIQFNFVENFSGKLIINFEKKLKKSAGEILNAQLNAIKILQNRNFSINQRLKNICEFFGIKNFSNFDKINHAENLIEIFLKMYEIEISDDNKKILRDNYLQNKNIKFPEKILENYLVNEFFMRLYPYAFSDDEIMNCKIFVTSFKFLQFALILTAIAKKNLSAQDWINLICAVNDKIDHSKGGMDAIKNFVINCDEKIFSALMLE